MCVCIAFSFKKKYAMARLHDRSGHTGYHPPTSSSSTLSVPRQRSVMLRSLKFSCRSAATSRFARCFSAAKGCGGPASAAAAADGRFRFFFFFPSSAAAPPGAGDEDGGPPRRSSPPLPNDTRALPASRVDFLPRVRARVCRGVTRA